MERDEHSQTQEIYFEIEEAFLIKDIEKYCTEMQ